MRLRSDSAHDLIQVIVMERVNMNDTQNQPSRDLAEPTPSEVVRKLRIGVAKEQFSVPDSFFEPLPEDILKGFAGG